MTTHDTFGGTEDLEGSLEDIIEYEITNLAAAIRENDKAWIKGITEQFYKEMNLDLQYFVKLKGTGKGAGFEDPLMDKEFIERSILSYETYYRKFKHRFDDKIDSHHKILTKITNMSKAGLYGGAFMFFLGCQILDPDSYNSFVVDIVDNHPKEALGMLSGLVLGEGISLLIRRDKTSKKEVKGDYIQPDIKSHRELEDFLLLEKTSSDNTKKLIEYSENHENFTLPQHREAINAFIVMKSNQQASTDYIDFLKGYGQGTLTAIRSIDPLYNELKDIVSRIKHTISFKEVRKTKTVPKIEKIPGTEDSVKKYRREYSSEGKPYLNEYFEKVPGTERTRIVEKDVYSHTEYTYGFDRVNALNALSSIDKFIKEHPVLGEIIFDVSGPSFGEIREEILHLTEIYNYIEKSLQDLETSANNGRVVVKREKFPPGEYQTYEGFMHRLAGYIDKHDSIRTKVEKSYQRLEENNQKIQNKFYPRKNFFSHYFENDFSGKRLWKEKFEPEIRSYFLKDCIKTGMKFLIPIGLAFGMAFAGPELYDRYMRRNTTAPVENVQDTTIYSPRVKP